MASKILDEARDVMRRRHYSIRTEKSYIGWIKRYIKHHGMKLRNDLENGERKVEEFLTHLAREEHVEPSTQNQALNALVFFYRHVLKRPMDDSINAERSAPRMKVPVVLTRDEVKRLLNSMEGTHQLVAKLL